MALSAPTPHHRHFYGASEGVFGPRPDDVIVVDIAGARRLAADAHYFASSTGDTNTDTNTNTAKVDGSRFNGGARAAATAVTVAAPASFSPSAQSPSPSRTLSPLRGLPHPSAVSPEATAATANSPTRSEAYYHNQQEYASVRARGAAVASALPLGALAMPSLREAMRGGGGGGGRGGLSSQRGQYHNNGTIAAGSYHDGSGDDHIFRAASPSATTPPRRGRGGPVAMLGSLNATVTRQQLRNGGVEGVPQQSTVLAGDAAAAKAVGGGGAEGSPASSSRHSVGAAANPASPPRRLGVDDRAESTAAFLSRLAQPRNETLESVSANAARMASSMKRPTAMDMRRAIQTTLATLREAPREDREAFGAYCEGIRKARNGPISGGGDGGGGGGTSPRSGGSSSRGQAKLAPHSDRVKAARARRLYNSTQQVMGPVGGAAMGSSSSSLSAPTSPRRPMSGSSSSHRLGGTTARGGGLSATVSSLIMSGGGGKLFVPVPPPNAAMTKLKAKERLQRERLERLKRGGDDDDDSGAACGLYGHHPVVVPAAAAAQQQPQQQSQQGIHPPSSSRPTAVGLGAHSGEGALSSASHAAELRAEQLAGGGCGAKSTSRHSSANTSKFLGDHLPPSSLPEPIIAVVGAAGDLVGSKAGKKATPPKHHRDHHHQQQHAAPAIATKRHDWASGAEYQWDHLYGSHSARRRLKAEHDRLAAVADRRAMANTNTAQPSHHGGDRDANDGRTLAAGAGGAVGASATMARADLIAAQQRALLAAPLPPVMAGGPVDSINLRRWVTMVVTALTTRQLLAAVVEGRAERAASAEEARERRATIAREEEAKALARLRRREAKGLAGDDDDDDDDESIADSSSNAAVGEGSVVSEPPR